MDRDFAQPSFSKAATCGAIGVTILKVKTTRHARCFMQINASAAVRAKAYARHRKNAYCAAGAAMFAQPAQCLSAASGDRFVTYYQKYFAIAIFTV